MIEGFIIDFVRDNKRFPLNKEIADGLRISPKTVSKHKKEIALGNYMPEMKVLTPQIIMGLFKSAQTGKASEVKLWLQLVEQWDYTKSKAIKKEVNVEEIHEIIIKYPGMDDEEEK